MLMCVLTIPWMGRQVPVTVGVFRATCAKAGLPHALLLQYIRCNLLFLGNL